MKRIILFIFLLFSFPALSTEVYVSPLWREDSIQSIQIKIPPVNNLKMALFKRNGYTYFIAESSDGLQVDDTSLQHLPVVHLKHPTALILRGVFPNDMYPEFFVQNRILFLKMVNNNRTQNNSFETKWLLNGALLELDDTSLIDFKDPNTMENLFVFLTPYSPLSVKEQYDTPEMTFLPTFQGIAIYPKTSSFHVQKSKTGFIIYPQNKKSLTIPKNVTSNFEQIDWKSYTNLTPQKTNDEIQNLRTFLLYIPEQGKEKLHQEMVQIYLSQGFAQNALEILKNMPENKIKASLTFLAYILQDDTAQALKQWKNIKNPSFELVLWKNTIDNASLLRETSFEKISLPPAMNFVFWRNLARKANKENNLILLKKAVEELEQISLNNYQKQSLIYFKGQIADQENNPKLATDIYDMAETLPLSQYSGQIKFSKIISQIETGEITIDEAVLKLEKIRHLFTGSNQEVQFLQTLANLYNEKKDIMQALQTERQLLSITQDDAILKRMQRRFEHFFIANENPIKRVIIYNEFKELMPTGIRAIYIKDRIIRDLITLDLLDKAYDLAFEATLTTFGKKQQEMALYAYLIAVISSDPKKQSEAKPYLSEDWQKQPVPTDMPEILSWAYKRIK